MITQGPFKAAVLPSYIFVAGFRSVNGYKGMLNLVKPDFSLQCTPSNYSPCKPS